MTQNIKNNSNSNSNNRSSNADVVFFFGFVFIVIAVIMGIGTTIYAVYTASIADTISTSSVNDAINMVASWGIASVIVLIIGKIMLAIGNSRPKKKEQEQGQHKITAWLGRSHKEEELKKEEEAEQEQQQQPPLTAEEIKSSLTDKDKRIMLAGKIIVIMGLVLFGLAIILAFVLGFRNFFFTISAIVLIIAGAIIYLWGLGSGSTRKKEKEKLS